MGVQTQAPAGRPGWVTFLSDYGLSDGYVGVCHGVIAVMAPHTRVIDLCHDLDPGDLRRGSALLAQSAPFLPAGVLLAVVEPAARPRRRGLVIAAGATYLVGPDNGLLWAAARVLGGPRVAYEIKTAALLRQPVSSTFHGRDVFAPIAARLSTGMDPSRVGPLVQVEDLVQLPEPVSRLTAHRLEGEVLTVDRFGNVQTSLHMSLLVDGGLHEGDLLRLHCRTGEVCLPFGRTFADARPGEPVGYIDAAGMFALALDTDSASVEYDLNPGDPVALRLGT